VPSRPRVHCGPVVDFRYIIFVSPVQIPASESILALFALNHLGTGYSLRHWFHEIDKPSTPRLKYGPVGAARIREKVWTKNNVQSAEEPVGRIKKG